MPFPSLKNFFTLRKKIFLFPVLLLISVVSFLSFNHANKTIAGAHQQSQEKIFKLIVDAGHGGNDQGTTGLNGVKEKNITLAIAKDIETLAPLYGIAVEMTRTRDVFMNPLQRINFTLQQNADAYISIHVNELRGYSYISGMQVYVSNSNPQFNQSCLLGSAVAKYLSTDFKVFPKLQDRAKNIYVLSENPIPAVLVECGFITNPNDLQMLTDSAQTMTIAKQILTGVEAYKNHQVTQAYAVQLPRSAFSSSQNKNLIASYHSGNHKKAIKKNNKAA